MVQDKGETAFIWPGKDMGLLSKPVLDPATPHLFVPLRGFSKPLCKASFFFFFKSALQNKNNLGLLKS